MRSPGVLFLLTAAFLGCGSSGRGGGGAIPLDQLANEYAAAYCRKLFTCCDVAERPSTPAGSGDEATCRANYQTTIASQFADIQAAIEGGILIYSGVKARACFDALVALPCTEWGGDEALERIPDCVHMVWGTVAPGGACIEGRECADGFCDLGSCVLNAKVGESCVGKPCQGGLYCDTDDVSGALTTCAALQSNGAPCNFDAECRSGGCGDVTPGSCGPTAICNGV
jgi:hypothetical protein